MNRWRAKFSAALGSNLAQVEATASTRAIRLLARNLRVIMHVGKGVASRHSQRAAALTFTSLLSLVPLVAVVFSIFKAFGGLEQAQGYLLDYIAPSSQGEVAAWFEKFIGAFNASAVGAVGMAFLLVTVISTLVNIEDAFNQIWAVRVRRSWGMRLIVYWSLLTVAPVLMGASLGATATIQSHSAVTWLAERLPLFSVLGAIVPILLSTLAFSTLYLVMPSVRVGVQAAITGGFAAAIIFEIAKSLYAVYAAKTISNNPLYGSLAAIPVFMVWMNYSWRVVLFGAEISHALQYLSTDPTEETDPRTNQATREEAAVRIAALVSESFAESRPPPKIQFLAARLLLPLHLAETLCFHLVKHGVLRNVIDGDGQSGLVPARPLDQLSVADIVRVLRHSVGVSHWAVADNSGDAIDHMLADAENEAMSLYVDMTFSELANVTKNAKESSKIPLSESTMAPAAEAAKQTHLEPSAAGAATHTSSKAKNVAANEVTDGPQATSEHVSATRVRGTARGGSHPSD
jgi:membrane protein